jgi:hypothetical protein
MSDLAPVWHGRITDDGKWNLSVEERPRRAQYLRSLQGQQIELIVRKARSQRSLDQNAYMHGVAFPLFAECWGEDIDTTKLLLLGECFGWKDTRDFHRLPVKPHTSHLSTRECTQFIDWMVAWGAREFGLMIPLPNEVEVT